MDVDNVIDVSGDLAAAQSRPEKRVRGWQLLAVVVLAILGTLVTNAMVAQSYIDQLKSLRKDVDKLEQWKDYIDEKLSEHEKAQARTEAQYENIQKTLDELRKSGNTDYRELRTLIERTHGMAHVRP
jgi:septal ring factor EnvC (AmiA/AmiB activator)